MLGPPGKAGSKPTASKLHWVVQHQVFLLLLWCGACGLFTINAAYTLGPVELDVLWLYWQPALPPLLMLCLWGAAVTRFSQLSIEYEQCFAARDRKYLLEGKEIQRMGLVLLAVVTGTAALYSMAASQHMLLTAEMVPLMLYMGLVAVALMPLGVLHRPTRQFFANTCVRVLLPLQEVSWADFLMADIFCSLSKSSADMATAMCHSATGPVMQSLAHQQYRPAAMCRPDGLLLLLAPCMPYIIRLVQCLIVHRTTGNKAQLFNALKYASSFPALMLTALEHQAHMRGVPFPRRTAWLCAMLINTLYAFYWDVEQDWDMPWLWATAKRRSALQTAGGARDSSSSSSSGLGAGLMARPLPGWPSTLLPGLKPDALYTPQWWYRWALLSNLVLRFAWLHRLVGDLQNSRLVSLMLACCEVWRRYQWSFIRVETELRKIAARSASAMSLSTMAPPPGSTTPPVTSPHAGAGARSPSPNTGWDPTAFPSKHPATPPAGGAFSQSIPGLGSIGPVEVPLYVAAGRVPQALPPVHPINPGPYNGQQPGHQPAHGHISTAAQGHIGSSHANGVVGHHGGSSKANVLSSGSAWHGITGASGSAGTHVAVGVGTLTQRQHPSGHGL